MSDEIVEIRRAPGPVIGRVIAGAVFTLGGAVLLLRLEAKLEWIGPALLLAIGVPLLAGGMYLLIRKPVRLRATRDGVWFGGGSVIPWTDITAIYAASLDVQASYVRARTQSIAFDLRSKRVLLRTPIGLWFATIAAVGDIDISPFDAGVSATVFASRLEAMRTRARGTEDAVTAGASEVPAARIVDRS